jgi:ferrous iron transport protein B
MIDELKARGGSLDVHRLKRRLGIPVVGVVGNKGIGLDDVRHLLATPETWADVSKLVPPPAGADERFGWVDGVFHECVRLPANTNSVTDRIDRVVLHPVWGVAVFAVAMILFFQMIFVVAAPFQDLSEQAVAWIGEQVGAMLPDGLVRSLVQDGLIAGVGSVVVFVPQIAFLLLMIAWMEGSGYMARAAFLVDRLMGWAGLEGRCFIALLSSYACAVPGIMATRSVPDPRARLATILVAPFMTCSARLPVYALLIGAFVPATSVAGIFSLQGLVLFGLYLLGSVTALVAAAVLKRGILRGQTYPFYLELPPYRWPTRRVVSGYVGAGVSAFLRKAGTVIMVASIALWGLLTFPRWEPPTELAQAAEAGDSSASAEIAARSSEYSLGGRLGHFIEPAVAPLGYDWRIAIGLIASLSAREVIVSSLSQIYAIEGGEEDLEGLAARLVAQKDEDGRPRYTLATALSLMVFFAYSLQCVSTLAAIRRETNGWKWPVLAFVSMLALAWIAAFVTYRGALALGW